MVIATVDGPKRMLGRRHLRAVSPGHGRNERIEMHVTWLKAKRVGVESRPRAKKMPVVACLRKLESRVDVLFSGFAKS